MKKLIPLLVAVVIAFAGCAAKDNKDKDSSSDRTDRAEQTEETAGAQFTQDETLVSAAMSSPYYVDCIRIDDWATGEYFVIRLDLSTITINSTGYLLEPDQLAELTAYMENYNDIVRAGNDNYWPTTSEYPDLALLFRYEIEGSTSEVFSGAVSYPDSWNDMKDYLYGYAVDLNAEIPDDYDPNDEILFDEFIDSLNLPSYFGRFDDSPSPRFDVTGDGHDDLVRCISYGSGVFRTGIVVYDLVNNEGYLLECADGFYMILDEDDEFAVVWVSNESTPNNPINVTGTIAIEDGGLVFVG